MSNERRLDDAVAKYAIFKFVGLEPHEMSKLHENLPERRPGVTCDADRHAIQFTDILSSKMDDAKKTYTTEVRVNLLHKERELYDPKKHGSTGAQPEHKTPAPRETLDAILGAIPWAFPRQTKDGFLISAIWSKDNGAIAKGEPVFIGKDAQWTDQIDSAQEFEKEWMARACLKGAYTDCVVGAKVISASEIESVEPEPDTSEQFVIRGRWISHEQGVYGRIVYLTKTRQWAELGNDTLEVCHAEAQEAYERTCQTSIDFVDRIEVVPVPNP